jgi:hypothetical protein
LFGLAVSKYLIDGHSKVIDAAEKRQFANKLVESSKVVATLAKRQSTNGLVELHWKVMVHMACAYLTK